MKKLSRISALLLLFSILFTFASCGSNDANGDPDGNGTTDVAGENDVVMSYEGFNLTESEFRCIATFIKDTEIYNQQYALYQQTGRVYSEADILAMKVGEDKTYAQALKEYTIEFAQRMLIVEKLCADAGVAISEQKDLDAINGYISDVEYAYGGKDLFDIELVKLGFSRNGIKRYQSLAYLFNLLYEHRYGEGGTARVPKEDIEKYFLENYYYFDGAIYSYVDSEKGSAVMFEYSDAEVTDYFNKNFVKVRHILYKTVDASMKPISAEDKAAKKAKAQAAIDAITNGEKKFEDFLSENEDAQSEYVFTRGEMVKPFEEASFNISVGNITLVETEYGFHVVEKLQLTETDLVGTKGDDGKVKGDRRDTVKKAMSAAKIRNEAVETFNKLNNGELKAYPEENKDKSYYSIVKPTLIDKNEGNTNLVDLLSKAENGKYNEKEFTSSGTQIYRKLEFGVDKLSSDIYATIEEKFSVEALVSYIVDFYDSVEMNNDYFNSFDIVSLPLLDDKFLSSKEG